jgi:magnesium chelatase family protein
MVGELALSGEVRRVKGVLLIALKAREKGLRGIIVPADSAGEAGVVEGRTFEQAKAELRRLTWIARSFIISSRHSKEI